MTQGVVPSPVLPTGAGNALLPSHAPPSYLFPCSPPPSPLLHPTPVNTTNNSRTYTRARFTQAPGSCIGLKKAAMTNISL